MGKPRNSSLRKIAETITIDNWVEAFLVELDDVPFFEYRQGEEDYIEFSAASAGQQATALLRVLLNQDGPPLVIDQPEDDLDNKVVLEIVDEIRTAKSNRQVVFSSHDANIVVNGDADLVVCCDYMLRPRLFGTNSRDIWRGVGGVRMSQP